jgi:FKBP-type peptidyl-prolyl cis-trans isomerase SlpA
MPQDVPRIGPGSRVTLHLSLALPDGTEALTTFDEEPLSVIMGDGTLPPGLELALYGLEPDDDQTLELEPHQAYGARDPENVHSMPRSDFTPDMDLEPGLILGFTLPSGQETPGLIREVGEDAVEVDFNHPLAGHRVVFRAQILEVQPAGAASEG